ncbi:hydrophobic/amphiphilic exporter-1, HAE1 family [Alkalithermobacter thermoalcaliphilus JW-YL-7 = DSM 7308]|uniref:Acriflavin resistance protein n=1 Tax=Alkalithermobacter thermoalcaliphilus JW-YL-7 = DSM 7308 TaxID=1121328 RepID=A0A150FSG2_CLOPD|nr:acriflavin resistance protein [[Clostridium] paradoxum JW-YL-7 = DSM 7308]SHK71013.1 hydrophobic/amphiphilic exporter-1, HAE1 family [[Clostridium] paradoxum JW-YL-7 = DSM 7308]
MNIAKICVKRPVTTLMFMLIALLIGVVSIFQLPVDLYPEIEIPVAIVSVDYSGVAPEEMEKLVTRPIEQAVSTVSNLKSVSSYSREGNSIVIVQFEYGTDMDFAALEMREKVDMIKRLLPEGSSNPLVLKIDPNAQPIVQIGVSSDTQIDKLQSIVENEIVPRFERIEGVASVSISGGNERQVKVEVSSEKLNGYDLTLSHIQNILRSENINLPGGTVNQGNKKLLVRTIGEFENIDQIRNIPITLRTGEVIRLSDIANVDLVFKDQNNISRVNGKNSIGISITKQSVANTVKVAQKVIDEVSKLDKEYKDIEIIVGMDQSEFINKSIKNVSQNAILGAIFAVIVLYLFLKNIRSTFIVGVAIPVSVITTFAFMYFGKLTINLISLGGLALGIGMLVDNSIVVLENIYRFRQEGYSNDEAAIKGTNEVIMAVFASTMTTIAVFLPIVFIQGFTAIVFKQLSFSVVFSLISSLIISLTVVPMLSSKILKLESESKKKFTLTDKILNTFSKFISNVQNRYEKLLNLALRKRKLSVFIAIAIFISSIFLVGMVGGEFFPKQDEGRFVVNIETPFGSSIDYSNEIVQKVENIVSKIPEKEKIFTQIGSSGEFRTSAENRSTVTVVLVDQKDRKRKTEDIVIDVREKVAKIPGAKITVSEVSSMQGAGPESDPIAIRIKGDDIDKLRQIGEDFANIISDIPGTSQVNVDIKLGDPELRIYVNRQVASIYGITTFEIANTIKSSIEGVRATRFKIDADEIDVNLSLDSNIRSSVDNMRQIMIRSAMGEKVPLGDLVTIEYGNSPTQIARINQSRVITVTSKLKGRDLKSVTDDIERKLNSYNLPAGYTYSFTGQQQDMIEAFKGLILALLLSIVIVYMILASQFESLIHPFTVMFSVPFALSGGFIGLFLTKRTLSVPAFIGIIMLSGIVVNNAIVLVDYINKLRENSLERKDAIIKAGITRFRPILMTTLTTVLGLIPLAFGIGEGGETQAPLATVVIGGLITSTLLTLVFIPVVYTIFDDITLKYKYKLRNKR